MTVTISGRGLLRKYNELKNQGFPVDAIAPQAAIYLTVNIKLQGKKTASGKVLQTQKDVTQFLLDEVHLAIVPFAFFGANENSTWYRLSVGTCNKTEIDELFLQLKKVLSSLS
jgi:aspartate aminotransferase